VRRQRGQFRVQGAGRAAGFGAPSAAGTQTWCAAAARARLAPHARCPLAPHARCPRLGLPLALLLQARLHSVSPTWQPSNAATNPRPTAAGRYENLSYGRIARTARQVRVVVAPGAGSAVAGCRRLASSRTFCAAAAPPGQPPALPRLAAPTTATAPPSPPSRLRRRCLARWSWRSCCWPAWRSQSSQRSAKTHPPPSCGATTSWPARRARVRRVRVRAQLADASGVCRARQPWAGHHSRTPGRSGGCGKRVGPLLVGLAARWQTYSQTGECPLPHTNTALAGDRRNRCVLGRGAHDLAGRRRSRRALLRRLRPWGRRLLRGGALGRLHPSVVEVGGQQARAKPGPAALIIMRLARFACRLHCGLHTPPAHALAA
jgi:hypothetical protein